MTKRHLKFVLTAALGLAFSLPVCGVASAADHDYGNECHQRMQHQKAKIDHDAARYGNNSEKVRHDVEKLDQERQWCRDHHADWDHNMFDVGIYVHH